MLTCDLYHPRLARLLTLFALAPASGCDTTAATNAATSSPKATSSATDTASSAVTTVASSSGQAAASSPPKPLPTEPAPTTVELDWSAKMWRELKSAKSLELVETDLGRCGLAGWHLPLPKGTTLSTLSPANGKGCRAENMPGPTGTQLMVVVGGDPLTALEIEAVKDIAFEASDGYILEQDTNGPALFYARVDREIAGQLTTCSSTYADFDRARAAYAVCRRLERLP